MQKTPDVSAIAVPFCLPALAASIFLVASVMVTTDKSICDCT
jgi:hypothetical protein